MIRRLRKQLRKNRGFTLVELMIVVAIVGILAALAIYGVRKYMTNAKTAEARNSLGQLGKDAVTAFFRESMASTVLGFGTATAATNSLCDGANVKAVPEDKALIARQKYQSAPADWVTWDCLKFSMNDPQYFQYDYETTGSLTAAGGSFKGFAHGDLDGDSTVSDFTIEGAIKSDAAGTTVVLAPNIGEKDPEE